MSWTISSYIARRFLGSVLAIFMMVLVLASLFDAIELARRVPDDEKFGFLSVLGMAALRAPSLSIKAAPFVMLLGALWTYARLARSSELVVTRAAGVSGWGVIAPTLFAAAALGALTTTVYNPFAAALLDKFDRLEAKIFRQDNRLLSVSREGLWLRQGNRDAQSVIHAQQSNSDGTKLGDVAVYLYQGDDDFIGRIDAQSGVLTPGFWELSNAVIQKVDPEHPEELIERREAAVYKLQTDLTATQIIDSFAAPETITFWRLPGFIRTLQEQGFSARRHILHFHASLASPLIFLAMALLGGAFSMRHARLGGLGRMALFATLTGFLVYFVFDIAQALAGSGVLSPLPAAWGPPIAALMLGAGLLFHFEDG
ncbi:MAG: LPS export ABC transporter permease LptG [Neomegalonema sp.]|nr:LPS export ABC transporter permease LptG [Neomegalonema sp.]